MTRPQRLSDAGEDRGGWITLLTTEHYNLQTQRAATISEANGRASIMVGAVSAGLIALGFQSSAGRSPGTTVFQVLVLSSLAFLSVFTYLRCLEISIDDWQFSQRVGRLRQAYAQLVPEIADLLSAAAGAEQATAMLTARRQKYQMLLSVAGTIGIIAAIIIGTDAGVLAYGLHAPLPAAVAVAAAVGLICVVTSIRFQRARWRGATTPGAAFVLGS